MQLQQHPADVHWQRDASRDHLVIVRRTAGLRRRAHTYIDKFTTSHFRLFEHRFPSVESAEIQLTVKKTQTNNR